MQAVSIRLEPYKESNVHKLYVQRIAIEQKHLSPLLHHGDVVSHVFEEQTVLEHYSIRLL